MYMDFFYTVSPHQIHYFSFADFFCIWFFQSARIGVDYSVLKFPPVEVLSGCILFLCLLLSIYDTNNL